MNKQRLLSVVLWLICLYHVFLGFTAFLSEDMAVRIADVVFGIKLEPHPQVSYLGKLLGVYAVAFGLVVAAAALDPPRHPALLNIVVALYAMRILNKIVFADLFSRAFDAP